MQTYQNTRNTQFHHQKTTQKYSNRRKINKNNTKKKTANKHQSNFKIKSARRLQSKFAAYMLKMNDNGIIDLYITKAKDERTAIKKQSFKNARRVTIDAAHAATNQIKPKPALLQQGKNVGYALATTVCRLVHKFTHNNQQVISAHTPTVTRFHKKEEPIMITHNSG